MDTIFIRELSLRGKHGVGEAERQTEQEFLIDIEVSFDTRAAAKSDNIADTLNYSDFRNVARDVVENNTFYLIERLADTIAQRLFADTRIAAVAVSIRKPAVYPDATPGIRIERKRV